MIDEANYRRALRALNARMEELAHQWGEPVGFGVMVPAYEELKDGPLKGFKFEDFISDD